MADEQRELIPGMKPPPDWRQLYAEAAKVFRPTTPITVNDVFAGRDEQLTRICDVVMQDGQHAILFGERGVGKTSLANVLSANLALSEEDRRKYGEILSPRVNCDSDDSFDSVWRKVFSRIELNRLRQPVGFGALPSAEGVTAIELLPLDCQDRERPRQIDPDVVRGVLAILAKHTLPIMIVDEFDQLGAGPRKAFADLIKMLSDHSVSATVVLVGVSESVDTLLKDHESVGRALVQVKMPRMANHEIRAILDGGIAKLGLSMERKVVRKIAAIAQGLPHYAHLLGLHASREALKEQTLAVTINHVTRAVKRATEDAQQSVRRAYHDAIRSSQKGNLYADVLLACAMAKGDELGYFKAQDVRGPMCEITGKAYDIPNFAQHLREFSGERRGGILQVIGETRRLSYHFRDPLMQPFVLMQGEVNGRLPEGFYTDESEFVL